MILLGKSEFFSQIKEVIKSLGLVFGDIGTSPIYTISIVFMTTSVTKTNVIGVLSLIIWTLSLLVFVMYVKFAMSLGKKGEGGTIVLKELLVPLLKSGKQATFVTFLSYIGISLLFGDGVITPAISILSAVEGFQFIPALKGLSQSVLIFIACMIAVILFMLQKKGPDKISAAFGPLMLIWFTVLSVSGVASLIHMPFVFKAFNPYYAIKFMFQNGFPAFFILSEVILCATGGEGLYADMGHLGRKPIQRASVLVFFALILTYLGQGAFILQHPKANFVLYEMIFYQAGFLYIPFLILSLFATVIASQAMISGIFSAVYQGITTKVLPTFKIDYTSSKFRSQIYVGAVNWFLLFSVIGLICHFKATHNLAAAYGFAVTGSMCITGIMMTWIFYLRKQHGRSIISTFLTFCSFIYFFSNTFKIPHGGYWSILLALIPFFIILIYTAGRNKAAKALKSMPIENFLEKYNQVYNKAHPIAGSALFFARNLNAIAPYILQIMFKNSIIYEDNIIISIITRDNPFGVIGFFKGELAPGLRIFEIHMGYMEIIDIEKILSNAGINAKVIFYGQDDIDTKHPIWKIFAFIKRATPSAVKFYQLQPYKLHGVVTVVKM